MPPIKYSDSSAFKGGREQASDRKACTTHPALSPKSPPERNPQHGATQSTRQSTDELPFALVHLTSLCQVIVSLRTLNRPASPARRHGHKLVHHLLRRDGLAGPLVNILQEQLVHVSMAKTCTRESQAVSCTINGIQQQQLQDT